MLRPKSVCFRNLLTEIDEENWVRYILARPDDISSSVLERYLSATMGYGKITKPTHLNRLFKIFEPRREKTLFSGFLTRSDTYWAELMIFFYFRFPVVLFDSLTI